MRPWFAWCLITCVVAGSLLKALGLGITTMNGITEFIPAVWAIGFGVQTTRLQRLKRNASAIWEIRITSPDGQIVNVDTEALYSMWRYGERSNDGYLDILMGPRIHVWVKPKGWQEPESRLAQLDGTAALPPGLR